jgi:hypothetical protein
MIGAIEITIVAETEIGTTITTADERVTTFDDELGARGTSQSRWSGSIETIASGTQQASIVADTTTQVESITARMLASNRTFGRSASDVMMNLGR